MAQDQRVKMAWNQEEEDRIATLEEAVVDLATAVNNLAAKSQLKSLVNIRQNEIIELQKKVESLESQVALLQQ